MKIQNLKYKNNSLGFTLVELLIALAIIAILSTILLGGFRSSQRRATDAQKKSDLKELANALELIYSDYQQYPSSSADGRINGCPFVKTGAGAVNACTWGEKEDAMRDANGTIYFREIPEDPTGASYYYRAINNNKAFQLYAHLDNTEDKNCINKDCAIPSPNGSNCGSGKNCNFAITSANVTATEVGE